jgi:hypothetical protein
MLNAGKSSAATSSKHTDTDRNLADIVHLRNGDMRVAVIEREER